MDGKKKKSEELSEVQTRRRLDRKGWRRPGHLTEADESEDPGWHDTVRAYEQSLSELD